MIFEVREPHKRVLKTCKGAHLGFLEIKGLICFEPFRLQSSSSFILHICNVNQNLLGMGFEKIDMAKVF